MSALRSSFVAMILVGMPCVPLFAQVGGLPSVSIPTVGLPGGTSVGGPSVGGIGGTGGTSETGGPGGIGGSGIGGIGGPGSGLDLANGGLGSTTGSLGGVIGGIVDPVTGLIGTTQSQLVGGRLVTTSMLATHVTLQQLRRAIRPRLSGYVAEVWVKDMPPESLLKMRKLRLAQLVKESGGRLEMDGFGNPAVRGRVVVIDPSRAALKAALRAGFVITSDDRDPILNMRSVTLNVPRAMTTANAVLLLRRSSPQMTVEVDHVFEPAGGSLAVSSVALASIITRSPSSFMPIGMIDGGVGETPALANASIFQKSFAGEGQATGHGTAVASLIIGSNGKFRGAAPGMSLLVGDVYGGNPAAGSATVIVRAMSWLAAQRPSVVNISLVGPRNALVERAVAALQARNILIVAAVGNDGPAAPPLYPASHLGVISVTGVDTTSRALAEAGKPTHLDYAAPGADLAAALPGSGYTIVRGTSFAAPFVTARLALTGSTGRLDAEASKGFGRIGRGIICKVCRVAPKQVRAK